jgi:hypothetical protein
MAGVAEVVGELATREGRTRRGLDRDHAQVGAASEHLAEEREDEPREVRPSPRAADEDVGVRLGEVHLRDRLLADHGLMEEDVVEHRAERVLRVVALRGLLDRLGDRDPEAAGRVRVLGEHSPTRGRLLGRARHAARPERLHEGAAIRLLVVRDPHHVDVDLEPEERAGERQ